MQSLSSASHEESLEIAAMDLMLPNATTPRFSLF